MNEEDPCETIRLLTTISSVLGIHSSPLDFAYENMMYDVVAHACSKKYLKMTLYSNLATERRSFFKVKKMKKYTCISYILTNNESNIRI